ncbi:LysM peptidoglycan-binding domain-containing protein [bacterium]|nr:LysM peptidoglycan-binding domain-containing protein [bacterium]
MSAVYGAPGALLRNYEVLDSYEGMTLLLHFDKPVQFRSSYDQAKHRYRLEVPRAKSLKLLGRQDLDHLLAISFYLKNLKRGLQLILYHRGYFKVKFESMLGGRTIQMFLPNPYPTRRALDPEGKKYVVCIDPGHGGNDPGAQGIQVEKELNMLVAKTLRDMINRHPGMVAFLTRNRDYKIKLQDRPKISDRAGADIFLSLHMNASTPPTRGFELYYLSEEGAEENIDTHVEGFKNQEEPPSEQDPLSLIKSDLVHKIILDIQQGENVNSSSLLAHSLALEMKKFPGSKSRGVHRQAFVVLKTLNTPSVLLEMGFITNRRDVNMYLASQSRQSMAKRLVEGIRSFLINQHVVPKPLREMALKGSATYPKPADILKREVNKPAPRQVHTPRVGVAFYEVKPGDTFIKIAQIYKIPYQALISANPGMVPSRIPVGKKLRIPVVQVQKTEKGIQK